VIAGLALIEDELEAERVAICGPRYAHLAAQQAHRSGHVSGSVVLDGQRVKAKRPRARSIDGHELTLPSWRAWRSHDPLDERVLEQMVLGVSTRRYCALLGAAVQRGGSPRSGQERQLPPTFVAQQQDRAVRA